MGVRRSEYPKYLRSRMYALTIRYHTIIPSDAGIISQGIISHRHYITGDAGGRLCPILEGHRPGAYLPRIFPPPRFRVNAVYSDEAHIALKDGSR